MPESSAEGVYTCASCGHLLDAIKAMRPEAKSLIPQFQQALKDEIAAIKKQGAYPYTARNGYRLRQQAQFSVYEFETNDVVVAPDDSPLTVQVGNRTVKGSLISSAGSRVTVELEADLGENVAQAIISTSPQYLLERLDETLEAMRQGSVTTFWPIVEKVFGAVQTKIGHIGSLLTSNRASREANDSQRDAIARALGSDVSIIWGPPGTGKTTTLGLLVDALMNAQLRVLVVAHTNVAVDQAVLKIIDASEGTHRIEEGKVVRYGNFAITDDEPLSKLSKTSIDGIALSLAGRDRSQLNELEQRLARLERTITALREMSPDATEERTARAALQEEQRGLTSTTNERDGLNERVTVLGRAIREGQDRLAEIQRAGFLKRLLLTGEKADLESRLSRLSTELAESQAKLRLAADRAPIFERRAREALARLDRAKITLTEHGKRIGIDVRTSDDLQKLEASTVIELQKVRSRIDEIKQRIAARSLDVLRNASVIVTTLTKSYLSAEVAEQRFDVAVIDEASMAPMPMVYFAVSRCQKKAVIVGDFRQLPPIAQAATDSVAQWLKRDIFEFMGVNGSRQEDKNVSLLNEQYRMHPTIASVANIHVYDRMLKNGTKAVARSFHDPFGVLVLVDSSELMPICWRTEDFTRFNPLHAFLCGTLRTKLYSAGLEEGELGVIAPYRAQAKLLRKLFADIGDDATICSTIHKFQGREKDAIVFDSTDSNPQRIGRLLSGSRDSDGGKILNVAITRPKDALVTIANAEYMRTHGAAASQLRNILDEIERSGSVVKAKSLLPAELVTVVEGTEERARAQFGAISVELFIRDAEDEVAAHLLRLAKTRRVVIRLGIAGLSPVLFEVLSPVGSAPSAKSIVITRKSSDRATAARLEKLGVRLIEGNPEIELIVGDSNMVMLPKVGHCLDGTPFGIALYDAENTTEELLKLARVYRLLREVDDDFSPTHFLSESRLKETCPSCGGELKIILGRYGPFVGCSNRSCQFKGNLTDQQILELLPKEARTCPNGHRMIVKRSWKGERRGVPFLGCSQYPECRATKSLSRSPRM